MNDDLLVKWAAIQFTSEVLSKVISQKNKISYSIAIEMIKAVSHKPFGFSTGIFNDLFGKVATQKH